MDQEDAAQEGILRGFLMLEDKRVTDEIKRWQYAKFQVYFGIIEFVRTKLCRERHRKKDGKQVCTPNFQAYNRNEPIIDDVPDEKWRSDLKAIEAKMDFDTLVAKLERRCHRRGRGGDRRQPPELRLLAACGSINETVRQLNINRITFRLRLSKLAL